MRRGGQVRRDEESPPRPGDVPKYSRCSVASNPSVPCDFHLKFNSPKLPRGYETETYLEESIPRHLFSLFLSLSQIFMTDDKLQSCSFSRSYRCIVE